VAGFVLFVFAVLGIEPGASHVLDKQCLYIPRHYGSVFRGDF
jgi:hypothetical protein